MSSNKSILFILCLCLLFITSKSWALSSDKSKPVEVEADNFHLDDAKKVTIYTGDVIITQGSMVLEADKVTIYGKRGKTDKIIALGNPVKFKQQPDGNQKLIRGQAQRFEFLVPKDRLILLNKATLWQGQNTFKSDRIVYDSKRSIVKAGSKDSNSKRVKIILEPAK